MLIASRVRLICVARSVKHVDVESGLGDARRCGIVMSAGRSKSTWPVGERVVGQTAAAATRGTREIGMRSVAVKYQSAMECSRRMPPAGRGAIHAEALDARADQGAGGTMAGAIRGAPQVQRRPRAPRGAAKGTARIPEALGLPSEEDASRAYSE